MVLNRENIHDVLAKYWQGTTSLEEEQGLQEYFVFNEAPPGLEEVAEYFRLVASEDDALDPDFDDRVLAHIDRKKGRIISFAPLMRVAAVLAVTVGIAGWLFFGNSDTPLASAELPVTSVDYSEQEMQKAFESTKSALFMVSSKLKEGQEHTSKLNKFHDAQVAIITVEQ